MKRWPFFTLMIIPHTEEKPKSIRIPKFIFNVLSVFLIVTLTSTSLWTFNYILIKRENNSLATVNTNNEFIIEEYSENFLSLYQDVKVLQDKVIVVQELEEEVRGLNEFDPTKSYFSVENQKAIAHVEQKGKITTSSIKDTKEVVDTLKSAIPDQEKSLNELIGFMEDKNEYMSSIPSIYPTYGRTTSSYGYRIDPVYGGYEFHTGIDIANSYFTPIYATADGIVTYAGYKSNGYGYQILINHGNGYETFYGHNSKVIVNIGDYVKKGETIAYMGSTGKSTGSHCHYEVHLYGETVNPSNYLK